MVLARVAYLIGAILGWFGLALLVPAGVAVFDANRTEVIAFVVSAAASTAVGLLLRWVGEAPPGPAAARRARGGRLHLPGHRPRRRAALHAGRALPHRRALRIDVRADDHRRHRARRLLALRPRHPLLARAEPLAGRHRRHHAVRRGAAEAGDRRARPVLRGSVGADGRGADAADSQDGGGAGARLPRPHGGGSGRAARRRAVVVRRDRPRVRHGRGRRLLPAPAVGDGVSAARRGVDPHGLHVPGRRQLRPPLPGAVHPIDASLPRRGARRLRRHRSAGKRHGDGPPGHEGRPRRGRRDPARDVPGRVGDHEHGLRHGRLRHLGRAIAGACCSG